MNKIGEWLGQARDWLDAKGKPAWIVAIVLGFIFAWPIGLSILLYMIWSGRMGCGRSKRRMKRALGRVGAGPTGNAAFDEYRDETLKRLEEEQTDTLDTPLEIDIEVPASVQLFIGKRVAIVPEFGVAFRIIPGNREPDQNGEFDSNPGRGIGSQRGTTDGPGFGFDLGDHGGLFMGIGFAYFFGTPRE